MYASSGPTELLLVGDRVVVLTPSDYPVRPDGARSAPSGTPTSSASGSGPGWVRGDSAAGTLRDPAPGAPRDPARTHTGDSAAPTRTGPSASTTAPKSPGSSASMVPAPERRVPTVVIRIVDIAQPSRPMLVAQEEVEGALVAAREVSGSVRVVMSSVPTLGGERVSTAADLGTVSGEELLPHVVTRSRTGEATRSAPAMNCRDLTHPDTASGPGVISVRTVDVAGAREGASPVVHTTGVAADGDVVYASRDRLFAATTRGGWGMLAGEDPAREGTGGVSTQVHAFDIGSPRQTHYLGSGSVTGYVLDRWAMSARDGMLRIATTRQPQPGIWSGRTDSAVSVLQESAGALTLVGEVTGLGKGERITSVRWFDDTALVVTFRQTDPLYVVDLSRPTSPRVRGELKVPGFSTYLHPIGDHRILGVGSAATDEGQVTGAQVSVFDISDPEEPRRESVLIRSKASTPVGEDARLFSYSPAHRSAVLPVMSMTTGSTTVERFRVGDDGGVIPAGILELGNLERMLALDADRFAVTSWQGSERTLSLVKLEGLVRTGSTSLT